MRKSFVALFALIVLSFSASAQEEKKAHRPDLPGTFLVDFGFNQVSGDVPSQFQKSFWGSRTVNFYYQYPIRLFRSNFSFNPGIGLSLERFKMSNGATLSFTNGDSTYILIAATDAVNGGEVKKSMLINNYVEIPLEFRFDTTPEDISRSFNVAFGFRVGILYDSFSKIKYNSGGEIKVLKDKQSHGMNPYRYGVYTRIGMGGFSTFCYYNLSTLFEEGKGPDKTQMNTWTIGISLNGF